MSDLDYELKNAKDYLQFSAAINTLFLILFHFADFNPIITQRFEDKNYSYALLISMLHGIWFYLESAILLMGGIYMGIFLWDRLSGIQQKGIWLFIGSIGILDILVFFGDWGDLVFPFSIYVGVLLLWLGFNMIYKGDIWFIFLSFGVAGSFAAQFLLFNAQSFQQNYLISGYYFDKIEYFGFVKIAVEILWLWGVIFRWYLSHTFKGIPVVIERAKRYAPYDPLFPSGE
ncbi:MAG: hypothetical protein D6732_02315 [Methanobacteriota archaeon]|nr:MAG: hypothetical protein D6732_02315 [Euryarchaeota archaeon]